MDASPASLLHRQAQNYLLFLADFPPDLKPAHLGVPPGEEETVKEKGYHYLLEHIHELSPRFQEVYLNSSACRDCIHCGKDFPYQHGDQTHRLCKGPWFYSPSLSMEDLPDVERLIDIHLAHLS